MEEFATGIVEDYHAARCPAVHHPRLSRGTARVVSSLVEERFAHWLLARYPAIDRICVDQGLSFPGRALCKPDVVVIRDSKIVLLVDLKMDLGWLRDLNGLPSLATKAAELLTQCSESRCTASVRTENSAVQRDRPALQLSPICEYVLLVLSGKNINPMLRDQVLEAARKVHTRVHSLVLWPGVHPNDPKYQTVDAAVEALRHGISEQAVEELDLVAQRVLS